MAVNNFWRAREGTFVVLLALLWAFEILPGKFWYAESLCLQLSTNDMKIRFNPCMLAILRILLLSAWVQKNYQFIKRVREQGHNSKASVPIITFGGYFCLLEIMVWTHWRLFWLLARLIDVWKVTHRTCRWRCV